VRNARTLAGLALLLLLTGCGVLRGRPPVAGVTALPTAGETPLLVRFDASRSADDGRIVEYAWDFGDGQTQTSTTPTDIEHVYERPGEFAATLRVTDEDGLSAAEDIAIHVENRIPIPSCRFSNDAPIVGELVLFDASGSLDPDGALVDFRWEFGDGTSARGTRVSHAYDEVALYTLRLTVEDDAGGIASIEHTMDVHIASPGRGCGSR
jgi:PKD repeat protein